MITYLGMTAPIAVFSVISWIKHPFQDSSEVTVNKINRKQILLLIVLTITVTVIFYYILAALGNKNLTFSTISITTSFLASSLAFLRSPYYAIAYAANDIILIILWTLAALDDSGYIPMVICFVIFFINDIYGFSNWQRMYKKQNKYKPDNCV
jgi:nicotinamide mononucleotide transporter PnuC